MTITQSRFGGNSEVGRNSEWDKSSKKQTNRGMEAGLGVAGSGLGVKAYGGTVNYRSDRASAQSRHAAKKFKDINSQRRTNLKDLATHRSNEAAYHKWNSGPKPRTNVTMQATSEHQSFPLRVSEHANEAARAQHGLTVAGRRLAAEGKDSGLRGAALHELQRHGDQRVKSAKLARQGKFISRTGTGVMAAGILGAAGSIYAHERSRGTISARRQTVAGLRSKHESARRQEINQSATDMERYRRMNGM